MLSSRNIMVLGLHVGQMTYSELILGIWWKVKDRCSIFQTDIPFSLVLFIEMTFPSDLALCKLKKLKYIYVDVWILFCLPICLFFHQYQLLYRNYWNQVGQVLSTLLSHFHSFKITDYSWSFSLLFKFYDQLINFYKINLPKFLLVSHGV